MYNAAHLVASIYTANTNRGLPHQEVLNWVLMAEESPLFVGETKHLQSLHIASMVLAYLWLLNVGWFGGKFGQLSQLLAILYMDGPPWVILKVTAWASHHTWYHPGHPGIPNIARQWNPEAPPWRSPKVGHIFYQRCLRMQGSNILWGKWLLSWSSLQLLLAQQFPHVQCSSSPWLFQLGWSCSHWFLAHFKTNL